MDSFQSILSLSFLGNTVKTYLIALGGFLLLYIVFQIFFRFFLKRVHKIAKRVAVDFDVSILRVIHDNKWLIFLIALVVYISIVLNLSSNVSFVAERFLTFFLILLAIRAGNHLIEFGVQKIVQKKSQPAEQFTIELLGKIARILVWVFGILFLISSFGYDISSLIAGLGIGGIAVALALQNILSDLISSISIYLDKPFQVGDLIVLGDKVGTVKSIGLKTTRVTSIHGEEIIFSNRKLTETEIQNYGRMKSRRVEVRFNVKYETPLKKMKKIPEIMEKIVKSVKDTTFEHAHFRGFDINGKNFEAVFFVNSKNHDIYLDRLQEVNFKIEEYFEKHKILFAHSPQK